MPASDPVSDSRVAVGVVFGGVSPEHEVSIISSVQAAHALDADRYRPVPIYVAKSGQWFTGGEDMLDVERFQDLGRVMREATPVALQPVPGRGARLVGVEPPGWFQKRTEVDVDVLLLGFHGGAGEGGGVQGLCEAYEIPFTGSATLGSAVGMDKALTKMICRDQNVPVVASATVREGEWEGREEPTLDRLVDELGLPVIVKPARLGSSIGITKADDRNELDAAIEEALRYDEKVIVERAVINLREINCSVLGTPRGARASVLEQPVRTEGEELLTFQEKYQRGEHGGTGGKRAAAGAKRSGASAGMASLDRLIPAPIPEEKADRIRALAVRVFRLFECSGVARIDFLIDDDTGEVFFNEINTIPGSFSFYLWEPTGVSFPELLHRMIQQALNRHREDTGRIRSYETNLLSTTSVRGLKGAKQG